MEIFNHFVEAGATISQHALRNTTLNPSGPGALSFGIFLITSYISSLVKGALVLVNQYCVAAKNLGVGGSVFQMCFLIYL